MGKKNTRTQDVANDIPPTYIWNGARAFIVCSTVLCRNVRTRVPPYMTQFVRTTTSCCLSRILCITFYASPLGGHAPADRGGIDGHDRLSSPFSTITRVLWCVECDWNIVKTVSNESSIRHIMRSLDI